MKTAEMHFPCYEFVRSRTLATLDAVAQLPNPQQALAWRPGVGRAHIGWQIMHVAITEDIIGSERIAPHKQGRYVSLWSRFRGGSTPDDQVPTLAEIRDALAGARELLIATLRELPEERLAEIPPAWAERRWTIRQGLSLIAWHEAHHQGQAHLTLNLFKAAPGISP